MTADTEADDQPETKAQFNNQALNNLSAERFGEIVEEAEIETPSGQVDSLEDVMNDITEAQKELNQYKSGSLALCAALNDEKVQARLDGDDELAEALSIIREAAFGVYLRVKRGDDELFGDRDGQYSDYFE
jgi:hypothetical protein